MASEAGLVSVVVLTVDRPDDVVCALRSVRSQTYGPIETVVVINGGDRGLTDVVRTADPSAKILIAANNLGCPGGRNYGARKAKGEFVFFLDDDGVLQEDAIETSVRFLQARPHFATVGIAVVPGRPGVSASFDPKRLGNKSRLYPNFSGGASCHRRDVFLRYGGFNASFMYGGEERDLAFRLLLDGYLIAYLPQTRMFHMQRKSPLRDEVARLKTNLANDIYFAWKFYPLPLAFAATLLKGFYYASFARTKGELPALLPELVSLPLRCLSSAACEREVASLEFLALVKILELIHVDPDDPLWHCAFRELASARQARRLKPWGRQQQKPRESVLETQKAMQS